MIRMYLTLPREDVARILNVPPEAWDRMDSHVKEDRNLDRELSEGLHKDICTCELCKEGEGDPGYALYLRFQKDKEATKLYYFNFEGLGRMSQEAHHYAVVNELHFDKYQCLGSTSDPQHIRQLMRLQLPPDSPFLKSFPSKISWF